MPEINENLSFPDPATPSRPLYPAKKTTPARGHSDQPNGAQIQRLKNAREISGLNAVKERFGRFELDIHPDKTRLIEFGRFALKDRRQRGQGRPETFDFPGLHALLREGQTREIPSWGANRSRGG